ncbi:hypothetical protein CesoFtcFv8_005550 [Champsocephalus esox]|uniref:Uncharacterized protein n=1 Tax=Champsocephalus esox TaxID=159716 RepID=A0AAN8H9U7_9TELE|nr:hypothetical protein CesoFtcFv8_005550 [Champsocephalus esox]
MTQERPGITTTTPIDTNRGNRTTRQPTRRQHSITHRHQPEPRPQTCPLRATSPHPALPLALTHNAYAQIPSTTHNQPTAAAPAPPAPQPSAKPPEAPLPPTHRTTPARRPPTAPPARQWHPAALSLPSPTSTHPQKPDTYITKQTKRQR